VDWFHQLVGVGCDDRTGNDFLPIVWVVPRFPKTGKRKRLVVLHVDEVGLFAFVKLLPFVETISQDQASPSF
jgi:hypothetical protein